MTVRDTYATGRDNTAEECGDKIMQNFVKYAKKSLWISNKDETQICVGKRPLHGLEEDGDRGTS